MEDGKETWFHAWYQCAHLLRRMQKWRRATLVGVHVCMRCASLWCAMPCNMCMCTARTGVTQVLELHGA
eukprot:4853581-Prorocentrum_lima.AAC.1